MRIPVLQAFLLAISCVLIALVPNDIRAEQQTIAIVTTSGTGPYGEAIAGFQDHLQKTAPGVPIAVHELPASGGAREKTRAKLRLAGATLLFTLGSEPTAWAADEFPQTPIVAGLLLNAGALPKGGNVTGVTLEFPVDVELQWLKRFFPGDRSIGVLFDPAVNQTRIATAKKVAKKLGITLVPYEVTSLRALPEALKSVSNRIDVLWGVNDPLVLAPATAKSVLVFSYRNRIPLTGLSNTWTEAGALYSLGRDYVDIGKQCGESATRILRGSKAGSIAPKPPRKVLYSINLKAARHMNLKISDSLVADAQNIVR